jgi:hypothetical protein
MYIIQSQRQGLYFECKGTIPETPFDYQDYTQEISKAKVFPTHEAAASELATLWDKTCTIIPLPILQTF